MDCSLRDVPDQDCRNIVSYPAPPNIAFKDMPPIAQAAACTCRTQPDNSRLFARQWVRQRSCPSPANIALMGVAHRASRVACNHTIQDPV